MNTRLNFPYVDKWVDKWEDIEDEKEKKKRKSFVKIEDETGGGDYYQNVETGDTVWDVPEDGES